MDSIYCYELFSNSFFWYEKLIKKIFELNIISGVNTTHFTASNSLFDAYPDVVYWSFEVVYTFPTENSSSALNFEINEPPRNGTCSINPPNGTTSTDFTINCTDWFDEDGIKDYSFYGKNIFLQKKISKFYFDLIVNSAKPSEQVMLAFTTMNISNIQLPAGYGNTSSINLTVHIRDVLNCVKEFYMDPIVVIPHNEAIDELINAIKQPNHLKTNNSIIRALASGHPNTVGQLVTLLSQEFNMRNKQELESVIASMYTVEIFWSLKLTCLGGVAAASISISPLGGKAVSEVRYIVVVLLKTRLTYIGDTMPEVWLSVSALRLQLEISQ